MESVLSSQHLAQPLASRLSAKGAAARVGPRLEAAAHAERDRLWGLLDSRESGLTTREASERLEKYGRNEVGQEKPPNALHRLGVALRNPLVLLLSALAAVTVVTAKESSDYVGAGLMLVMVVLGVALRFVQETRADTAAAKLRAMLPLTATVVRDGAPRELDQADAAQQRAIESYRKLDELPFDFARRMMSVVVESEAGVELLCKGAPEAVFLKCRSFVLNDQVQPIEPSHIEDLREEYRALSAEGFRVLAVAGKALPKRATYTKGDEEDLVLKGYVAFLDPAKETARAAIEALAAHGIEVKVLTGDNDLVSRKVCRDVGLAAERILLGSDVEAMSDEALAKGAEGVQLFARLSPLHKQRVVRALQKQGHVVGFLGDGINDAPALRVADVGISVDTAVDIAKASADVILMEKSLLVLDEGVREGRKVFANIVKYVRMGASSNFGNMFSVLGASALFPFVPMRPIQVLTNNLLYDFSQVPIPADSVDPESVAKPRPWRIDQIERFILFIGPISSIFDYTTYALMWVVFRCRLLEHLLPPAGTSSVLLQHLDPGLGADSTYAAALFQTGWFVESLMTQTLIIHIIRTNKIPFLQSRAGWPLVATTATIMALGAYVPFSPVGPYLGLTSLPPLYWPFLVATLLGYSLVTQVIKRWLLGRAWI